MRLHLGPNVADPTIAASVTHEEQEQLQGFMHYSTVFGEVTQQRSVAVVETDEGVDYTFLLKRIGRRPYEAHDRYLAPVVAAIEQLTLLPDEQDAKLANVNIYPQRVRDGRLPLSASIAWPEASDADVSSFATGIMHGLAIATRYKQDLMSRKRDVLSRNVYAHLRRYRDEDSYFGWPGVSLQTNPIGSCSVDTSGDEFESDAPMFTVYQHNLYGYKQQLICLGGAIAIANADELLKEAKL